MKRILLFLSLCFGTDTLYSMQSDDADPRLLVATAAKRTMLIEAHARAKLLVPRLSPRGTVPLHSPDLNVCASVLASQRKMMDYVRIYYEAEQRYLAIGDDLDRNCQDFLTKIVVDGNTIANYVPVQTSPDALSAELFLTSAYSNHLPDEAIIRWIEAFETHDPFLQAAMKGHLRDAYARQRDAASHSCHLLLQAIIDAPTIKQLQLIAGYCYPAIQFYKTTMQYLKILSEQMLARTFSDDTHTEQDIAYYKDMRALIAWYDANSTQINVLYNAMADRLTKRAGTDITSPLLTNCIDHSPLTIIPIERVIQTPQTSDEELVAAFAQSGKECTSPHSPSSKNKQKKKRGSPSSTPTSPSASSDEPTSDESATTQAEAAAPADSPSHRNWFYTKRVLDWHEGDGEFALIEQGYTNQPRTQEELDKQVMYHRIPFAIEERFADLAIIRHHPDHPNDDTLNFPGAIQFANGTVEYGIFSIAIEQAKNRIYHRNFTLHAPAELRTALNECLQTILTPAIQSQYKRLPSDTEHRYIVEENGLTIRITDTHGVTYILFKGHKMALPHMR